MSKCLLKLIFMKVEDNRKVFMNKDFDKELRRVLKSNNEERLRNLFNDIYVQYYKLVYFCISKYIKNDEDIKDLVQDTFLNAFSNINNVKTSVKYYILMTARNLSINHLKKVEKTIITSIEELDYNNDISYSSNFYLELICDLKKVLTEEEINLILLHAVQGYTFKMLEDVFHKNYKALNKSYERAIKKYKESVDKK